MEDVGVPPVVLAGGVEEGALNLVVLVGEATGLRLEKGQVEVVDYLSVYGEGVDEGLVVDL